MSADPLPFRPLPRGRLLAMTFGALAAAVVIVCGAILPAEFNKDPLGLGKATGLSRLWAPAEQTVSAASAGGALAREYAIPFRQDAVEIPLGGFMTGAENSELEYKVRMPKGATLTYSWQVTGADRADDFHFDQHGHTTPAPGQPMAVVTFRQAFGLKQQGAITAPFDGIQGWQFSNSSEHPVVVRLKLAGFYELVPPGAEGNRAGVVANVPAERARPGAPAALRSTP
jgi:hypothetical protein